jgi:hypothetical protein
MICYAGLHGAAVQCAAGVGAREHAAGGGGHPRLLHRRQVSTPLHHRMRQPHQHSTDCVLVVRWISVCIASAGGCCCVCLCKKRSTLELLVGLQLWRAHESFQPVATLHSASNLLLPDGRLSYLLQGQGPSAGEGGAEAAVHGGGAGRPARRTASRRPVSRVWPGYGVLRRHDLLLTWFRCLQAGL